ncbi:hypothetical protein [Halocella sp. SP3-1]|uniref:hypothetical protein n=1 Tax=Halocella sp. SP3-1 TaxID=2382161 RepID=UPI000F7502D1|nr:hypothetical protein [Halocella sp. SP3-1]AZO95287.1 hypothetical protein D7D81_12170 [Halocella sp. SP3-1]
MAVSAYTYANMNLNALNGVLGDLSAIGTVVKCALLGNSYIPAQNRHEVFTADDWAASTAYSVGDYVIPTTATGHIYLCTTAGTSDSAEPSWPTVDVNTVVDGDVTWECVENGDLAYFEISGTGYTSGGQEISNKTLAQVEGITTFDGDNVSWVNSTLTARYAVVYETSTGILLSYQDFGEEKSSSSGNFEIQWNTEGIATITATQAV